MKVTRAALALALALGLLWAPLAEAQQAVKTYRVGFLGGGPAPSPTLTRLLEALRPLGYVEGQNLVIERLYADGKADRLPVLAAELVQLSVDRNSRRSNRGVGGEEPPAGDRPCRSCR